VTVELNYQPVEEATWLSPIVVVLKKNGKLRVYVDFRKLNKATKNNPYFLPFFDEILNIINFRQIIRIWNRFS
jgi:hypothetical protein